MSDTPPSLPRTNDEPVRLNRARLIAAGVEFCGALLATAGIAWAVERFYAISQADVVSAPDVVFALVVLVTGLAGGALMWGIASAIRQLEDFNESVTALQAGLSTPRAGNPGEAPRLIAAPRNEIQERLMREMITVMREVRDIALLTDSQRTARQDIEAGLHARRLQEEVPELLRDHNWFEASKRISGARERFPGLDVWDALEQQVAAVRSQVEARDIEAATRQVDELISLGAWERAQDVITDLLERHPAAEGAIDLARRLKRQRNKAEAETRMRLMAQAQEYVNKREWGEALAVAKSVIQRFPKSQEAEALRLQLPTLEANAEIKVRQRLESNIRELLNQRRFDEALAMTHELIERYPHSKQAEVLREQLPRLEEMASQGAFAASR